MEIHKVNGMFNLGSLKQPAVYLAITDARVRANFLSVYILKFGLRYEPYSSATTVIWESYH